MDSEKSRLIQKYPLINEMIRQKTLFWTNENIIPFENMVNNISLGEDDIQDASRRSDRFSSFIKTVFPQTRESNGIIESPIYKISNMKRSLERSYGMDISGNMFLKCDHALPISGSIKARGGIYEVLKHAEDLAIREGKLRIMDDHAVLASEEMRRFFSNYHIAVGSTGNLGLSIGIMGSKLGFKVTVHMSSDAKGWKKELLRSQGVLVMEYDQDYSKAVEEGRRLSALDPNSHFVDDENSVDLFLGYSVAASRLKKQLDRLSVKVDREKPLFVYLPCGVGGGPGGVAFGLKHIFKDAVHFFFAEPTHSPCMLLGCMTGTHDRYSVQDLGIDNKTIADGLAVGRASGFVGKILENLVGGCYTVSDEQMMAYLAMMHDSEGEKLEPSALAGFGIVPFFASKEFKKYLERFDIQEKNISHLFWSTGGSMVPEEIHRKDYDEGKLLLQKLVSHNA